MRGVNRCLSISRAFKMSSGGLCALVIVGLMLQFRQTSKIYCPIPLKYRNETSLSLWAWKPLPHTELPPKVLSVNGDRLGYGQDKSLYPGVGSRTSNRTLYVYLESGLCNVLQSAASAFTVAEREDFNIKLVFNHGDFGPESWEDLFEEPKLGTMNVTLPDQAAHSQLGSSCRGRKFISEWKKFKADWKTAPDGSQIGCVSVYRWREPPFPLSVHWFYRSLVPSQVVREAIQTYKESVEWHKYQWIGVHLRRTDNMQTMRKLIRRSKFRDLVDHKSPNNEDILPLSSYTDKMKKIAQILPGHNLEYYQEVKPIRFFLATDNPDARNYVMQSFPLGMVSDYEKEDYSRIRESIVGMQSSIVDLFLLATCEVLIGTPYSTFSAAAKYIGQNFYLEPDFAYKTISV